MNKMCDREGRRPIPNEETGDFQKLSNSLTSIKETYASRPYLSGVKLKIAYTVGLLIVLGLAGRGCGPDKSATSSEPQRQAASASLPKRVSFSELAVPPKPDVTPQFLERGKWAYAQNCA